VGPPRPDPKCLVGRVSTSSNVTDALAGSGEVPWPGGEPRMEPICPEGSVVFLGTTGARAGGIVGVEVLCGSEVGRKKAL
jgi:hypothetical protein